MADFPPIFQNKYPQVIEKKHDSTIESLIQLQFVVSHSDSQQTFNTRCSYFLVNQPFSIKRDTQ